jgi:hypothetical protein
MRCVRPHVLWSSIVGRVELLRQLHRKSPETNAESSLRPRFGGITGRGLSIAAPAVNERGRQLRRPMSRRLSWAEFAAAAVAAAEFQDVGLASRRSRQ